MPTMDSQIRYRRELQEQRIRRSRRITFLGQAVLAPPAIVAMLLLDVPPLWFVGIIAALTPANFTFMWLTAQKHGSLPHHGGGLGRRIVCRAGMSVLALAATGLALWQWGPLAGALGAIAYASSLWFTARHVGLLLEIRGARA